MIEVQRVFKFLRNNSAQLIAVGGGKGGIGKSFVSSRLAVALSKLGKRVTIIDLDLGCGNLHTCLGIRDASTNISDFLKGRVSSLNDLIVPTVQEKLNFIGGLNDSLDIANIGNNEIEKLLENLKKIRSDYVLLDLGAGTANHTLEFFLRADHSIVTITPELTSIENAYRFLKTGFYYKMASMSQSDKVKGLIVEAMDFKNKFGIKTPADLVNYIYANELESAQKLKQFINGFQPKILVNQVRRFSDRKLGDSVKSVCHKYFGLRAQYLGFIEFDNSVWHSLRSNKPSLFDSNNHHLNNQFLTLAKKISTKEWHKQAI